MHISELHIKNFRSIKEAKLECSELTALLGRNGAGKSSFLHAIDYFYSLSSQIKDEDYFNRDTSSPIEIRVSFTKLNEKEKEAFGLYIHNDMLTVNKKITCENGTYHSRYYGTTLQFPEFSRIRTFGKRDKVSEWNNLVDNGYLPGMTRVKSSDLVDTGMNDFESQHPELCILMEQENQFFGATSVGGGKLDNYTRFVLIPANRDASDETSRKGSISQLIDLIVLRKVNAREDIQEFKKEFEQRIKTLMGPENLKELNELGDALTESLKQFSPGAAINLNWSEAKAPEIPLPNPIATLIEDDFEGDISRKGHGLQRALIITLLQELAKSQVPKSEDEQSGEEIIDIILAIEEPELFLHPSRCRYLSSLLLKLSSEQPRGTAAQIIYATHSPYFVDLHRFDKIRCIKKIQIPGVNVKCCIATKFSLEEASIELTRINDDNPANYTAQSFMARAIPVMNVIVNEGFFADKVLVVEGLCEVGVFWKLQEILNKKWEEKGIVIVPANGTNNLDRPVVIFKGLDIPTYYVFDGDSKFREAEDDKKNSAIKKNKINLRISNAEPVEFPETVVTDKYAVFCDDIESSIKDITGENNFNNIRQRVSNELGFQRPKQILKNIVGASRFIEILYKEEGMRVNILEEIVNKVTNM